jgi:hypothetical protein
MPQQLRHDRARFGDSSPKRRGRPIVVVLAVALAALLAGSAPDVAVSGQAETRIVPPIHRMMYLPDDRDRRIADAKDVLVAGCMAGQGLDYTPQVENVTGDGTLAALRPFGLESLENIAAEPLPPEPVRGERYALALFGDPDLRMVARGERLEISWPATGCQADAEHRLLGDQRQRASELRLRFYDGERDAREQLDRDPVFVALNAGWRTCVNRLGIDAPDPAELLSLLPADANLATDSAVRADLRCKQESGYLNTAYARLAFLQQHWLDAHGDLIGEWLALRQRQDTVALQVLNSR